MESVIEEAVTAEVIEPKEESLTPLKQFLKLKKYKEKAKEKIKERFKKCADKDARIIVKDGKIYMDPSRYDYSDLLKIK